MTTTLPDLTTFRKQAYTLWGQGRDSVSDLMDAILMTRRVSSFAELSLSSMFRRQGSNLCLISETCKLLRFAATEFRL